MIRFRQIFVTVCSILAAFGLQAQEFEADGLRFYLDEDGNATVGGYVYFAEESGILEIPDSVLTPEHINLGKVPVVSVGEMAFRNRKMEEVRFPETVKKIGNGAFANCSSLSKLAGEDYLNYIGDQSFYNTSLTEIELGSEITNIESGAFYGCFLETIKIDATTPPVCGDNAFGNYNGPFFFESCKLIIPEGSVKAYVHAPCWGAFFQRQEISDFVYYLDFSQYTAQLFSYKEDAERQKELILPEKVEFLDEEYIVTKIGGFGFTMTTPGGSLDKGGFSGDDMLESVEFGNQTLTIMDSAFENCENLSSVSLPGSLESIRSDAFFGCKNLKGITLPAGVTGIGRNAFGKTGLEVVESLAQTPPSAADAFSRKTCANARLVVGDESAAEYESAPGWSDFWNCVEVDGLVYLVDKSDGTACVTYEYNGGGWNYAGMTEAIVLPEVYKDGQKYDVLYVGKGAFSPFYVGPTMITPDDIYIRKSSSDNEPEHLHRVKLPSSILEIREGAFSYCDLEEVELNEGLKLIEKGAFEYSDITSIVIPSTVTSIQEKAFSNCSKLSEIILGSSLKYIGERAFDYCPELRSVTCNSLVPPVVESENTFDYNTYEYCVLAVPEETYYDYKATPVWMKFQTMEKSGIDSIVIDGETLGGITDVYDINGHRMSDTVEGLPGGIYIVVARGKTFKISLP